MADASYRPAFVSACLMLAIATALGAATLLDLFDGPGSPREERIATTPAPPTSASAAKRFAGDARFYLSRRYAMKEQFKAVQSSVMLSAFGRAASPEVLTGQDGYFFLDNTDALATTFGVSGFSADDIDTWRAALTRISAPRDFVLLVAPNKHSVYTDKLPAWAQISAQGPTRLDAIQDLANPVDLASVFSDARKADPDAPLYHKTDSHWTEYGAALAVSAALSDTKNALDYTWTTTTVDGGDQARLLALSDRITEDMPVLTGPGNLECLTAAGAPYVPVIFDPLPEYQFSCRSDTGATGRALIFMDSYGMSALPAIARNYAETHFIWNMQIDPDLIAQIDPDTIFLVIVERELQSLDPRGMSQ